MPRSSASVKTSRSVGPGRHSAGFQGLPETPERRARQFKPAFAIRSPSIHEMSPDIPDSEAEEEKYDDAGSVYFSGGFQDVIAPVRHESPPIRYRFTPEPQEGQRFVDGRPYRFGPAGISKSAPQTPVRKAISEERQDRRITRSVSRKRTTPKSVDPPSSDNESLVSPDTPPTSKPVRTHVPARSSFSIADAIQLCHVPSAPMPLQTPVKRGPGRPRKNPLPAQSVSSHYEARHAAPPNVLIGKNGTAPHMAIKVADPPKRPRGRPRKSAPAEMTVSNSSGMTPGPVMPKPSDSKSVSVGASGKKRGRPKGSKNKPKGNTVAAAGSFAVVSVSAPTALISVSAPPTAHTRGRSTIPTLPRTNSRPPSASAAHTASELRVTTPGPSNAKSTHLTRTSTPSPSLSFFSGRQCADKDCTLILPPFNEYRWLLCLRCREKTLGQHYGKKASQGSDSLSVGQLMLGDQRDGMDKEKENVAIGDGCFNFNDHASENVESQTVDTMSGATVAGDSTEEYLPEDKERSSTFDVVCTPSNVNEEVRTEPGRLDDATSSSQSILGKRKEAPTSDGQPDGLFRNSIGLTLPRVLPKLAHASHTPPASTMLCEYQTRTQLYEALVERLVPSEASSMNQDTSTPETGHPTETFVHLVPLSPNGAAPATAAGADSQPKQVLFKGSCEVVEDPLALIDETYVRSMGKDVAWGSKLPVKTDRDLTTVILRGRTGSIEMPCECVTRESKCGGYMTLTVSEIETPSTGIRAVKGWKIEIEVAH